MERKVIQVRAGKTWETSFLIAVEAMTIGLIGVYQSSPGIWEVVECDEGTVVARFTAEHVARHFARRIEPMFDWKGIARRAKEGQVTKRERAIYNRIIEMRQHESYVESPRK